MHVSFPRRPIDRVEWASRYARLGWPVLILWWTENGVCACRAHGFCRMGRGKHEKCTADECKVCAPGKHPIAEFCPRGVDDASCSLRKVGQWFRRYPSANIGIACGKFLVIDIDPRHGGDRQMAELTRLNGKLPATVVARTGGNGYHYLFEPVGFETRGKACVGVDVKSQGGYIVVEPSVTSGEYRWLRPPETKLATVPHWLQPMLRQPEPPAPPRVADSDVPLERRVERAKAYLDRVEPAVSGQNGSATTLLAAQHVALGFSLPVESAMLALQAWNQRCQPPWSERELRRKVLEAIKKGRSVAPGQHLASRRGTDP